MLGEVFFDALGLTQEERRVLTGDFDEFCQGLHGMAELFCELGVLLVLPGVAEGGEPGLL